MREKKESRMPPRLVARAPERKELSFPAMGEWRKSQLRGRSGAHSVWEAFLASKWSCGVGSWTEKSRRPRREVWAADEGLRLDKATQGTNTEGEEGPRLSGVRRWTLQRRLRNGQFFKICNSRNNWRHCSGWRHVPWQFQTQTQTRRLEREGAGRASVQWGSHQSSANYFSFRGFNKWALDGQPLKCILWKKIN